MMVQVEFQSLIDGVNCVNGGAAPPPKRLVRTLVQTIYLYVYVIMLHCICS